MATRWLISLRIDLAATPVVAVLKSMWLVPRTRALNESLRGIRLEDDMLEKGDDGEHAVADDEQGLTLADECVRGQWWWLR